MSDFHIVGFGFRIDSKTVILRGNFDLPGGVIDHRLVGTAVAEFELECFASTGQSQQLMPETDAEDRDLT